jgi:hypothetical protein
MVESDKAFDRPQRYSTEELSREEIDRLVQGVDDIYFGGAYPEPDDYIGRFTYFQAHQWGVSVAEAGKRSISQMFESLQSGTNPVVVLTAFRSDQLIAQNRLSNNSLALDIRDLGWGYTRVKGTFGDSTQSSNGPKQSVGISEDSIVSTSHLGPTKVVPAVSKLMEIYRQEAALIMLPKTQEAFVLASNDSTLPLGPWPATLEQLATYYARMRGRPTDWVFAFEAAASDSAMTRWAVDVFFKNKLPQDTTQTQQSSEKLP